MFRLPEAIVAPGSHDEERMSVDIAIKRRRILDAMVLVVYEHVELTRLIEQR